MLLLILQVLNLPLELSFELAHLLFKLQVISSFLVHLFLPFYLRLVDLIERLSQLLLYHPFRVLVLRDLLPQLLDLLALLANLIVQILIFFL